MSDLTTLNEKIVEALARLPAADPFTRNVGPTDDQREDGPVWRLVDATCARADSQLRERLQDEYFRAGPLEALLRDDAITEIIVNGRDSIWFERRGRLERNDDIFLSDLTYRNFISRLSREASIQTSLDCPFADGKWRGSRVHLITPPASGDQAVLTLRRHPANPWSLERLVEVAWAKPESAGLLRGMVERKENFLVVGCTGSGKTSVLNACLALTDPLERAVIIEDTCELRSPNPASLKLLTRHDSTGHLRSIDQSELLKQALRMRPDRLIMGEIRGGEAKDLLMAFATGHSGCMGTLHADSARQALIRLEMLIQLGAPQWSLQAVRTLIFLSLQSVVVVGKTRDGQRRLEGIYRISSLEEIGFLIEKVG